MTSNEHDTRAAGKAPKGHKEEETMQINLMRLRQLQRFYLDLKNEKRSIPFERGLTRAKLLKMIHDAGPDFMQQVELVSPLLSPDDKPFKDNERWMKNWSRVPNSFSTSFTNHKKIVARMLPAGSKQGTAAHAKLGSGSGTAHDESFVEVSGHSPPEDSTSEPTLDSTLCVEKPTEHSETRHQDERPQGSFTAFAEKGSSSNVPVSEAVLKALGEFTLEPQTVPSPGGAAVATDLTNTSRQVRFADSDASTAHAARLFPGKQQSSDPDSGRSLSPAVRPKPGRVRDGVERDASQLQQLRTPAGRADTDKKDKGNDLTEEQAEEDKEWRTEQLRAWYRWWHKGHVERESARSANK
ncbi:hypothetical protein CEP51_014990 [Fusarium floridanum]|uniref:Uncharacterized protein n=1 Tax=Fusarium floridanum TaxID=1325733 RepID=A0A428PIC4_9HYPO|nr:hypothetical protein CEP51_014990 [Fusarium floridanum]